MTAPPRLSIVALVLANLVPLAGVVWLDWRVLDVLLLYWVENVIIGCINVLRMLVAMRGDNLGRTGRRSGSLLLIPFFIMHYGLFCYGHYIGVVSLFGDGYFDDSVDPEGIALAGSFALTRIWQTPMWIAVAAIAASHLMSFLTNFIGQGEFRRTTPQELMHRPYGRIVVMHLTVIAGGILVSMLGDPIWMLVALIAIKTGIDLHMHSRERDVFGSTELNRA